MLVLAILIPCARAEMGSHDIDKLSFGGFGKELHSFDKSLTHGMHKMDHEVKKDQQAMKQAMQNPMKTMSEAGINISYEEKNVTFGPGNKVHEKETSCVDGSCETRARTGHMVDTNSAEMANEHAEAEKRAEAEKEAEARKVEAERLRKEKMEHSKVEAEKRAEAEK